MELFSIFKPFPELVAAFSSRTDGSMNARLAKEEGSAEAVNRRQFLGRIGVGAERTIASLMVHGADVIEVGSREAGLSMRNVDGLTTRDAGIFLTVTAADCLPIFMYSPAERRIALIHAGWPGLSRGIVSKAVRQFMTASDIRVGIGPSIHSCHYEVRDDLVKIFGSYPDVITQKDGRTFLSLQGVASAQLMALGVSPLYTEVSSACTACDANYFSFRRDRPEKIESMMAVLGLTL